MTGADNNRIIVPGTGNALATRAGRYAREARETFMGGIFVPDDLQVVRLN